MTLQKANWMQNVTYEARMDRNIIKGIIQHEGIEKPLSLKVSATGAMSVSIAAGGAFVQGDDSAGQGMYYVWNDAATTLSGFSLPPSGQKKIDTVILRINDPQASGTAGDNASFGIVPGSPVPTAGTALPAALPSSALPLAYINITAGQASIAAGDIANARVLCGGIEHIGCYRMWPIPTTQSGAVFPNGWLACDGAEISRTTYAELFEVIGTTYGSAGGTTFTLPNFAGRMPAGRGTAPGGSVNKAIGSPSGVDTIAIAAGNLPVHTHGINHDHGAFTSSTESVDHSHGQSVTANNGGPALRNDYDSDPAFGGQVFPQGINTGGQSANHTHSIDVPNFTGTSGDGSGTLLGTALNNLPPYMPVQMLIRAL